MEEFWRSLVLRISGKLYTQTMVPSLHFVKLGLSHLIELKPIRIGEKREQARYFYHHCSKDSEIKLQKKIFLRFLLCKIKQKINII